MSRPRSHDEQYMNPYEAQPSFSPAPKASDSPITTSIRSPLQIQALLFQQLSTALLIDGPPLCPLPHRVLLILPTDLLSYLRHHPPMRPVLPMGALHGAVVKQYNNEKTWHAKVPIGGGTPSVLGVMIWMVGTMFPRRAEPILLNEFRITR